MDKLTIATGLSNTHPERIGYFEQYLDHALNLDNLDRIDFVFFTSPDSENMIEMIPSQLNYTVVRDSYDYGVILADYHQFHYCLEVNNVDYMMFLDSDVVLKKDAYSLCKFVCETEPMDDSVICLMNRHQVLNKSHPVYTTKRLDRIFVEKDMQYCNPWGMVINKNFWLKFLRPKWSMVQYFDWTLIEHYNEKNMIRILIPAVSRSWHIGNVGINYDTELFLSQGFGDPYCIENSDEIPKTYQIGAI